MPCQTATVQNGGGGREVEGAEAENISEELRRVSTPAQAAYRGARDDDGGMTAEARVAYRADKCLR